MSKVIETIDGVEITERHVELFAIRFGIDNIPDNVPGIVGTLAGWISSPESKDADAYLLESVETRDEFTTIRDAFNVKISGAVKPLDQLSNLSIVEVVPDWAVLIAAVNKASEEAKPEGEAAAGSEEAQA